MHTLLAFAVTLVAVTLVSVRFRIPPFLTLIGGAVLYGLLAGMDPAAILPTATAGAGKVFSTLGVIIFAGSSLAALLEGRCGTLVRCPRAFRPSLCPLWQTIDGLRMNLDADGRRAQSPWTGMTM